MKLKIDKLVPAPSATGREGANFSFSDCYVEVGYAGLKHAGVIPGMKGRSSEEVESEIRRRRRIGLIPRDTKRAFYHRSDEGIIIYIPEIKRVT
jgi:hypothetical protein